MLAVRLNNGLTFTFLFLLKISPKVLNENSK